MLGRLEGRLRSLSANEIVNVALWMEVDDLIWSNSGVKSLYIYIQYTSHSCTAYTASQIPTVKAQPFKAHDSGAAVACEALETKSGFRGLKGQNSRDSSSRLDIG
jgi:hypothetical protein